MAPSKNERTNVAHVNMMTDTIVGNLPCDGLRIVMRSLLAYHPEITATFELETRKFIEQVAPTIFNSESSSLDLQGLKSAQKTIRCMSSSGLCLKSIPLLETLAVQAATLGAEPNVISDEVQGFLASVDGDIVQTMTAIQKTLNVPTGERELLDDEKTILSQLFQSLTGCESVAQQSKREYPYGRGLVATASVLGIPGRVLTPPAESSVLEGLEVPPPPMLSETFELNGQKLPRVFSGLWQMSSSAWGAAPTSKIVKQFADYVQTGLTAFDMADHYGDAEIVYGRFRSSYTHKSSVFAATKYCVFHPIEATQDVVRANVSERCRRLQMDRVDLLQFHWQFYEDDQYLKVLRYLDEDDRVGMIGLCNFDTEHLEKALETGVGIYSNQVQFSLIDSRPVMKMGGVCEKHNIKLLTYGTLCGGFLAEKWLGRAEPDVYDDSITPSQRKYFGMINSWGSWELFQELLRALKEIAVKRNVSVSNVATRWVLDFPYVGAVLVGTRMGISEHAAENLASLGWSLDKDDHELIEKILAKSRRVEIFETMGDCGAEYR